MAVDQPEVATVVEREVRIAARPETVFEFFTDPDKMVLWKGREADLDPQPGGIYRVEMGDRSSRAASTSRSTGPAAWSSRGGGRGRSRPGRTAFRPDRAGSR